MKYALITFRKRIRAVVEQDTPPTQNHIEINDEQETLINSLKAPALIGGEIVSLRELRQQHRHKLRFDEDSEEWILDPLTAEEFVEAKALKIKELEASRYQAEVAGITLPDGKEVRTDKETQAELGKALSVIATVNPALEIDWKFPSGEVVPMDVAQIQQIAGAVFAHVQATRTAYKEKAALVADATTKDELNAIIW